MANCEAGRVRVSLEYQRPGLEKQLGSLQVCAIRANFIGTFYPSEAWT